MAAVAPVIDKIAFKFRTTDAGIHTVVPIATVINSGYYIRFVAIGVKTDGNLHLSDRVNALENDNGTLSNTETVVVNHTSFAAFVGHLNITPDFDAYVQNTSGGTVDWNGFVEIVKNEP